MVTRFCNHSLQLSKAKQAVGMESRLLNPMQNCPFETARYTRMLACFSGHYRADSERIGFSNPGVDSANGNSAFVLVTEPDIQRNLLNSTWQRIPVVIQEQFSTDSVTSELEMAENWGC